MKNGVNYFGKKNWIGSFEEYVDLVRETPEVTRTAYQRLYDMILDRKSVV